MLIVAANFAAYGATTLGETLCCDVALVHASRFVTIAGIRDGTTITMAEKCWACTNMVLCIGLRNGSWRSLGCHVASPGRAIRLRAQRDPTGVAKLFAALQLQRTQVIAHSWITTTRPLPSTPRIAAAVAAVFVLGFVLARIHVVVLALPLLLPLLLVLLMLVLPLLLP